MPAPSGLDVLVLGPVVAGGVRVDRLLERALLARLALASGRPVPDDRLAADLWGESELTRPAERLRVLASRLRAALSPLPGSHLTRTPGGYRLDARPADLDTAREAAERAHAAIRAGHHQLAREAAATALSQWRGAALEDLRAIPYAAAEGARLDAWRLDLLVERLTADLALGSAAEVHAELARLAGEHPLNERLHGLLALALYQTGRQAEALERLTGLRRTLAGELGVDPAPETARLELLILRQDPSLRLPDRPSPISSTVPPEPSAGLQSAEPSPVPRTAEPSPASRTAEPLSAPEAAQPSAGSAHPAPSHAAESAHRAADPAPVSPAPASASQAAQPSTPSAHPAPAHAAAQLSASSAHPTPAHAAAQLSASSAHPAAEPAPSHAAEPVRGSSPRLPGPMTSFVGRDADLAALVDRLARPGLVTLTGGPGSGKSRLAIEAARAVAADRTVTVVELAPLARREAIWAALGAEPGADDPAHKTAEQLEGGLLVLDNAEHLVEPAAELVTALLGRTTALTVLVTSQRPLLAAGEELHRVGPLAGAAAARLFRERCAPDQASAAAEAVTAICAAADRLPLGIELAAGLTRVLTVEQLAARVEDRLRLLVGGRRDAGNRHTSLRAALDWSHDLLEGRERAVLRMVSVFSGGFTLEAAEHVAGYLSDPAVPDPAGLRLTGPHPAGSNPTGPNHAGSNPTEPNPTGPNPTGSIPTGPGLDAGSAHGASGDAPIPAGDVAPALAELVDRSLVTVEAHGGRRFGLLETVKDYARARLAGSGEGEAVRAGHLAWCLEFATRMGEPDDFATAEAVTALFAEWPNLLDALDAAPGTGRAAGGLRLALAMHTPWLIRGWYREAERHFAALADAPGSTVAERAAALCGHGFVTTMIGRFDEAADLLAKADKLAGDDSLAMNVRYYRGIVEIERGRLPDALPPLLDGLALAERLANRQRMSAFADALGTLHLYSGDAEAALDRYVMANALDRESGDEHGLARGLSNQAQALLGMGRPREAVACAEESGHYARRLDDRQILPLNEQVHGNAAMAAGDLDTAESHLRAALAYADEDGTGAGMAHIDLADVLILRGATGEAATLLAAVYAEAPEGSTPWLAAEAVSAALALARGDRDTALGLAEAATGRYAASGFGWPRYADRLAAVRDELGL
ncbi:AfsR/SARP family transcriptional regulator [Nonomuraea typhae]|uniref:AfsR/SARP family transcriptional regulator n=1 Tax=Nonomuraea typhae TaxID=2603600 RepID=A0ABW7Z8A1_9ACTN